MKSKLYYHVRNTEYPHTYCIIKKHNCMLVGYSVTHKNDNFCKKTGRSISENRARSLEKVYSNNKLQPVNSISNVKIHPAVNNSLSRILSDSKEKFEDVSKVAIFNNRDSYSSNKKVPVITFL